MSKSAALEAISPEARALLCGEYGGKKLYVPKVFNPDSALARLIGEEATRAIIAKCGGISIIVPTVKSEDSREVAERVLELRRQGAFIADIAQAVNRSERQVFRILEVGKDTQDTADDERARADRFTKDARDRREAAEKARKEQHSRVLGGKSHLIERG